ncbi:adenylyl-sulfate reductase subunit alpha [Roseburia rectibacter]|jgi:adenylylsulfate reductase subunit A|uniref:adenylyl-sulfate reductase subunit alpha n=1 Tax=Roseburia rectibacter TaxID=2763062 RepID=UPI00164B0D27|nr:adenylyl-sulfate reductase subunit alpha [Roseburia rectibacter]UMZ00825.1 adenylyl-sulfate reductase subunit alpha [Roseburia rectibacter]
MKTEIITSDVLIIGGGTSGCYAALTIAEQRPELNVVIAEKANIIRSGCLAAGVNALNAYITEGRKPQDYVDYATKDANGIVRSDLLLSMSQGLNRVTARLEELGLVILKDENGKYVTRGNRNIKINGENIKPILAEAVRAQKNVKVINHVNITDYITVQDQVTGAYGFDVNEKKAYIFSAKAILCATGGAAGLYRPNNPGFSRHKMWYPPFNTGAGYAMGILAGAEMTTFEMRFIALRCKDTIAPTGTIAQGVGAKQINSLGDVYETKYGITTEERVYGTVAENQEGRGPCYLHTEGIKDEQGKDLLKAYLNMAPSQTLKWIESGKEPNEQDVEIEGTEPYIVGGHTASGYWIDDARRTTLKGLYAAGDVAGGCPQKYVTGALVEGEIAAETILKDLELADADLQSEEELEKLAEKADREYEAYFAEKKSFFGTEQVEEAMQKVMDAYAGGIGTNYRYNEKQLNIAEEKIDQLLALTKDLTAKDTDDLLHIYEVKERLVVCKSVIAHLKARKETRWRGFGQNMDHPGTKEEWNRKAVNSVYENGKIKILLRDLAQTPDFGQKGGTL